jgi:small subunit ribosomal protein S21
LQIIIGLVAEIELPQVKEVGDGMATFVKVKPDEPIDVAIRRFKRRVQEEDVLSEFRARQHYTKPSQIRYQKKKERMRGGGVKRWPRI